MDRLYGNGRKFASFLLNLSHFLYHVCIYVCVCLFNACVSMYVCVHKQPCIFVCMYVLVCIICVHICDPICQNPT